MTKIFQDDGRKVHNLLCVGGVHFEPNFAEAVFAKWGENEAFGVTHLMANQWLMTVYPEAFWVFQQKRAFSGSFSFREIIEDHLEFHLREYPYIDEPFCRVRLR